LSISRTVQGGQSYLLINYGGAGTDGDIISIDEAPSGGVARFEFADGTFKSLAELTEPLDHPPNPDITGTDGNDILAGNASNNVMSGLAGDDIIDGHAGDDTIHAGEGNDIVSGGAGNDSIQGDAGNDTIYADDGADQIQGGDGDDTLFGGAGDDIIEGGAGNDTLQGDSGFNTLRGGAGNDTYRFQQDSYMDWIDDVEGANTLDFGDNVDVSKLYATVQDGSVIFSTNANGTHGTTISGFDAANWSFKLNGQTYADFNTLRAALPSSGLSQIEHMRREIIDAALDSVLSTTGGTLSGDGHTISVQDHAETQDFNGHSTYDLTHSIDVATAGGENADSSLFGFSGYTEQERNDATSSTTSTVTYQIPETVYEWHWVTRKKR